MSLDSSLALVFVIAALVVGAPGFAQAQHFSGEAGQAATSGPAHGASGLNAASVGGAGTSAETPAQHDARMAWWRDARFGLFIHWGLYSIPAGEWKGETKHAEWIRHTAQIPIGEYDQLVPRFNPVKFNADEWVRMAREAGMKYLVITSKHHDGFCLWDSAHTDFDIMSTPFRRDILKELSDACARGGVRFCFYHSIMDWHHSDYLPRRPWETGALTRDVAGQPAPDFERYVGYLKAQLRELVGRYQPGVLWFDGEWEETWTHERGADLYQYVRGLAPEIIINNRVDKGREGMQGLTREGGFVGDFGTPEQEVPPNGLPGVDWESCLTMNNNWGFNAADHNWKSAPQLIRTLCDIASKGGNLLLNVGPTAEGEFPPEAVERLAAMGAWMKVNGEAIYGTQASPLPEQPAWGRCTQKRTADGVTLYLHVFEWPASGELVLHGLATEARGARLLATPEAPVAVTRREDALVIRPQSPPRDAAASVIAVMLGGAPEIVPPPRISAASDIFIDALEVTFATDVPGAEIRYTTDGSEPTSSSTSAGTPARLTETTTVRARLFRSGQALSGARAAEFRRVPALPPVDVGTTQPGLYYTYWRGEWDVLPKFEQIARSRFGRADDLDISLRDRDEHFGLVFQGLLSVPQTGVYTFYLNSDDGSRLLIDGHVAVDNDGLHPAREQSGRIALAAGPHAFRLEYFQRTGDLDLDLWWAGPGFERQSIAPTQYSRATGP